MTFGMYLSSLGLADKSPAKQVAPRSKADDKAMLARMGIVEKKGKNLG